MSDTLKEAVDLTPKPLLTISGHEDAVYGIAYLPGGGRLVTCSGDGTVRMWDVENGEQEGMAMEHDGWVEALAVTRDGKRILSGGMDEVLRVWDVETHQPIAKWGGHDTTIRCAVVSPDSRLVASGNSEGRIVITEMKEDEQTKQHASGIKAARHSGCVNSVCFSSDGTKLASGHDDTMIRVFDVENGDLILGPIKGHRRKVNSVVWSLDGSWLFTASADQTIRVWDAETGEPIGEPWTGHTDFVASLSLSPDGTKLASGSHDKTVRFWGTESGEPIGEPLQHEEDVWAVTFSPSGEFMACGGADQKVSIWRVPWWDDSKETHKSFLDLPAMTMPRPIATDLDRRLDYLDLPTNRRPSPSRTRLCSTTYATGDPSRTQASAFSWRLWRTLPHLLFGHSRDPPQHAEVTTIYPGFATQRIYVASSDDESTTERPTEPLPTAPGHYRGFSIVAESVSSTDSHNENQQTPAPPVNSEQVQVSCCALFRRRARPGTTPAQPAVELTQRISPTSNAPPPVVVAPPHPSTQHIMDLPAVFELPPGMA